MPSPDFWAEAGLTPEEMTVVPPRAGSRRLSSLATDDTVSVLAFCGRSAGLPTLDRVDFVTDADPAPRVRQAVLVRGGSSETSMVVLMTPAGAGATRLSARGPALGSPVTYDLPATGADDCPLTGSTDAVTVVACGGWVRLRLSGVPDPVLRGPAYLDVMVTREGRPVEGFTFVERTAHGRALAMSGPYRPGVEYAVFLRPGQRRPDLTFRLAPRR